MQALAKRNGIDLLPAEGGNTDRDTSGALPLEGGAFVAGQIEAHRTNIAAIKHRMLPWTTDAEVSQYLEKTVASMEKYLASLEKAQGSLRS